MTYHPWLTKQDTALWQVGDLAEQNRSFNIASVVAKKMQNKDEYMYDCPTIEPYQIIRIVNAAWPKSFSRIESNKKAIVERGWLPYNRELMPHPMIRASIINEEEELESGDYTKIIIPQHNIHKIIDLANDAPIFNPRYITAPPTNPAATIPNFKSGVAA